MTLALTSQVFLWVLGHAGSGRDSYPVGSKTEGASTKHFLLFRGTVPIKLLITHWICVAYQGGGGGGGRGVSPHPRPEHGDAQQGPSRGMFHQSGCLLMACLGLRSESC